MSVKEVRPINQTQFTQFGLPKAETKIDLCYKEKPLDLLSQLNPLNFLGEPA